MDPALLHLRNPSFGRHSMFVAFVLFVFSCALLHAQVFGQGGQSVRSGGYAVYQASQHPAEFAQMRLALELNTPSAQVTVSPFKGFSETGYLLWVRDSAVVMTREASMNPVRLASIVVIPFSEIRDIVVPGRSYLQRGATAGLAIGAVVSLLVGYGALDSDDGEDFWSYVTSYGLHSSGSALIGTLVGGAIGAGIGALLSRSERQIVDFNAEDYATLRGLAVYCNVEPSCLKGFR
jgi:hypothetical protein